MSNSKGYQLPEIKEMAKNIKKVYKSASAEDIAAGVRWYRDAYLLGVELVPGDADRGAAIIAALSPALGWDANVRAAIAACRPGSRRTAGVLGASWAKAKKLVKGADIDKTLGGPKVRAFFACIAAAGDTSTVCVDRHAVAIALNVFIDGKTYGKTVAGHRYEMIADAYRMAAKGTGLTPAELQAVTWVAWRRTPWRARPAA